MKYFVITLITGTILVSCSKNNSTITLPKNSTIEYDITGTNCIAVVQYYNQTESGEQQIFSNDTTHWNLSFQTIKDNQFIQLQATAGHCINPTIGNVTGKIFVDGILKKEATGNVVSLTLDR